VSITYSERDESSLQTLNLVFVIFIIIIIIAFRG
jgi:heme/copper-type cytochrome/quinol oxidase subunit 4